MKRVFDFLVALSGLIVLSPFLLVIAIWIIADSKGGVFYRQKRVGKDGKDFLLLKFRTMAVNSDSKLLLTVGMKDPRITRSGYFIRKYKIDELPQLINVLLGEMSLVGPRPEVRKYVSLFQNDFDVVLRVKPGITDWASVNFSNENEILAQYADPEKAYIEVVLPQKITIAKSYVQDRNFALDIKIIFSTLRKILR
jgi:lipopolysaccharide/colanic/teichoic acid biosynthesis glycosyltransferase